MGHNKKNQKLHKILEEKSGCVGSKLVPKTLEFMSCISNSLMGNLEQVFFL
jgi:hypothetical protein